MVISGIWQFRDAAVINSYTLNANVSDTFDNDFRSNSQIFDSMGFYKTNENKINEIEYGAYLAFSNGEWTNENYRYVDFGTGSDISSDLYNIISALAMPVQNLTITYRRSTDNIILSTQIISYGGYATQPSDPTLQNYTFVGWSDSRTEFNEFDFTEPIYADTTIYAYFVIYPKVTFNNESQSTSIYVPPDTYLQQPQDPTSTNPLKEFVCWSYSEYAEDEFDFESTPITNDLTLYAYYDIGHYAFFWNEGYKYGEPEIVRSYDTPTRPLVNPTSFNPNKVFKGWSSNDYYYQAYDFTQLLNSNVNIYAAYDLTETSQEKVDFKFADYLGSKLDELKEEFKIKNEIVIGDEKLINNITNSESIIYVIIKYSTPSYGYNVKSQPVEINVITNGNNLEITKMLFSAFTERNNWQIINYANAPYYIGTSQYIKQQYSGPVVLSNYQEVGYGYRSILYITSNLYIIENIVDASNITINNVNIKPLSFAMQYNMNGNTQQFPDYNISKTVKSASTVALTISLPAINYQGYIKELYKLTDLDITNGYVDVDKIDIPSYYGDLEKATYIYGNINCNINDYGDYYRIQLPQGAVSGNDIALSYVYNLLKHCLTVVKGEVSGNDDFIIKFLIGTIEFTKEMKLLNMNYTTTPNEVPSIIFNFME